MHIMKTFVVLLLVVIVSVSNEEYGYFWQITDIHYDVEYMSGGDPYFRCTKPCVSPDCTTPCSSLGDYKCDVPIKMLQSVLSFMKDEGEVDFIIWTGDSPPNYSFWTYLEPYTEKMVLDAVSTVNEEIRKVFPNTVVYPTIGNHDAYPANFFKPPPESSPWISSLVDTWDGYGLPQDAIKQAKYAGFYSVLHENGLRIVVFNSNFCDTLNPYADLFRYDQGGQFKWLNETLMNSKKNGEKVFVIAHISPGVGDVNEIPHYSEYCDEMLEQIFDLHSDVIVASFYGHEHCDSFRLFHDKKTGRIPLSVGYVSIGLDTATGHNPGVRRYKYSKDTKEIVDYDQYYIDMKESFEKGEYVWDKEYSAKEAYNMTSLTPNDWEYLVDHMILDSKLFEKFRYFMHGSSKESPPPPCSDKCKKMQICTLMYPTWYSYMDCVTN